MRMRKLTAYLCAIVLMVTMLAIAPQKAFALTNPFDLQNNMEVVYSAASGANGGFSDSDIAASATKPKITVEKKELEKSDAAGKTITVQVSVSDAANKFATVSLIFCYDTRITLIKRSDYWLTPGSALQGFATMSNKTSTDGCIRFDVANSSDKGKDGVLFEADFQVPAGIVGGEVFPIGIQYSSESETKSLFTNVNQDNAGSLMQAWTFTKGITNGYIKIKGSAAGVTGTTGDCDWSFNNETGQMTISGSNKNMGNYSTSTGGTDQPWYSFRDKIKSVVIENGVRDIGTAAFCGCENLTSVQIGNSVVNIWHNAFTRCKNLKKIKIPANVHYIATSAFNQCTKLEEVTLAEGLKSIGSFSFGYCESLKAITIPSTVTAIGDTAFCGCKTLESIELPAGLTKLEEKVFSSCSGLKTVTLSAGITEICEEAFDGCTALKKVYYPLTTTDRDKITIGSKNDPLISATWYYGSSPTSGTTGDCSWAFDEATGTLTISGSGKMADYDDVSPQAPWYGLNSKILSIQIGGEVTRIGDFAFTAATKVKAVTIPDSVQSIGESAFLWCYALDQVQLGSGLKSIGIMAFDNNYTGKNKLSKITIPSSITEIDHHAFGYRYNPSANPQFSKVDSFEITGECGSEAQKYAKSNGFTFVSSKHRWDEGTVTLAATTDTPGQKFYTCTGCGETKTEEIPKLTTTDPGTTDPGTTDPGATEPQIVEQPLNLKIKGLKATASGTKAIKLSWTKLKKKDQKKVGKFVIEISTDKKFTKDVITKTVSAKKNSVTIKKLKPGKKYFIRIRAIKEEGNIRYVTKWFKKSIKLAKK